MLRIATFRAKVLAGLRDPRSLFKGRELAALRADVGVAWVHLASEAGTGHTVKRVKNLVTARSRNRDHTPLVRLGPLVGVELRQ